MSNGLSKLAAMREKLAASSAGGGGSKDPSIFPFWNIDVGKSCILRFVPDADEKNPYIWAEKILFKWTFSDPRNPHKPVTVTMPCKEMYDGPKTCAVMNVLRPMWKSDEDTARKYWPKRSYIYAGFVRKSDWPEQNPPENPLRKFLVNKKMHGFIKETLLSTDEATMFTHSPDDYENGTDFVVKKTKDGQWDSYSTSQWARSPSSLTDAEILAIEKYGLIDLKSGFPPRPSEEAFALQLDMLNAALDGKPWNPAWDATFKAYAKDGASGGDHDADDSPAIPVARANPAATSDALARIRGGSKPAPVAKAEPEPESVPETKQAAKPEQVSGTASDVMSRLAAIKAKQAKAANAG